MPLTFYKGFLDELNKEHAAHITVITFTCGCEENQSLQNCESCRIYYFGLAFANIYTQLYEKIDKWQAMLSD